MTTFVKITVAFVMLMASIGVFAAVNINTADAVTIQSELKGIGPEKAKAIVAYRDSHGKFKSIDELANVKGIGKKTVEQNKNNIVFEEPEALK